VLVLGVDLKLLHVGTTKQDSCPGAWLHGPRATGGPLPSNAVTLAYVEQVLAERLKTVEIYGVPGGCPSCHDGELRGAILKVRQLREGPTGACPPSGITALVPRVR
jgi:hypothetical protein